MGQTEETNKSHILSFQEKNSKTKFGKVTSTMIGSPRLWSKYDHQKEQSKKAKVMQMKSEAKSKYYDNSK